MVWLLLLVAGALEIVWATAAGESDAFTDLWPSVVVLACMPLTFWLLALVTRRLPAGTAYAIWTGFGAAGTALVGIATRGEGAGALRLTGLALVIAGVVLLRIAESDDPSERRDKAAARR